MVLARLSGQVRIAMANTYVSECRRASLATCLPCGGQAQPRKGPGKGLCQDASNKGCACPTTAASY